MVKPGGDMSSPLGEIPFIFKGPCSGKLTGTVGDSGTMRFNETRSNTVGTIERFELEDNRRCNNGGVSCAATGTELARSSTGADPNEFGLDDVTEGP